MANQSLKDSLYEKDTVVVPSHPKGFRDVFIETRCWLNLKIDKRRLSSIKYIAVYQTSPVSAITHYGRIEAFKPANQIGRYNVYLLGSPIEIRHVPYTLADVCALQGPRYTSLDRIQSAEHLAGAFAAC